MSNNRPFFSTFLTAFRARSGVQKASTSPSGAVTGASLSSAYAHAAHHQSAASTASQAANFSSAARSTSSKPQQQSSAQQAASAPARSGPSPPTNFPQSARRHHSTSPYARSPGSPGPGLRAMSGVTSPTSKQRRGSDSSSDGFRESAADKWYVGGRTAGGEEKFYKLSMVKKPRSLDRLSIDRMSL